MDKLQRGTKTKIFANGKVSWNIVLSIQFLKYLFGTRSATDDPVMLLWDNFSPHWTAEIVAYAAQKNSVLQHVPPGYTHCCQPADIVWNKPLKEATSGFWSDYLTDESAKMLARTRPRPTTNWYLMGPPFTYVGRHLTDIA
ncbi:unnamed protein product [Phytophthora fragariaefolia]|uniref:Unnamed protein product n=1 Tax=Phytophthora fragariaefolia TaxID=1490495 RepID=A0A9W6TLH8_9STRA|nr:unnamed protein product [Phytophthora fragariaefolia]